MNKFYYKKFELKIPKETYYPKEDSELLAKNIQAKKNSFVLDMGTGSGLQAIIALSQGAKVLAVDINKTALQACKKNAELNGFKIQTKKSNLFEKVPEKFDLIIFNPPYVISEKIEDISIDGEKKGRKILDQFLEKLKKHLKPKGKCLLLQSSLNGLKKTEKKLKKLGLKFKIVERKRIFFEELIVLEITN